MERMVHYTGVPLCEVYEDRSGVAISQGSVLSFNVLRPDGSYYGYSTVEELSSAHNIMLRVC